MKYLITGSSGFVGKELCNYILSQGDDVFSYDLPKNILDVKQIEEAIGKVDFVIHAAAVADLYETAKDIDKNFEVNVRGTWNVAKACSKYKKKLIFISTCCVYGNTIDDIEEENKTIPKTTEPYACSKMAGEYLLRGFEGLEYVILRIGTVYGEGMRETLFNFIAFEKILNNLTVYVFGDGKQTRKYVYIKDLVKKIYACCSAKSGEIINICSDEETSVLDTILTVEDLTGKDAKVKFLGKRQGEVLREHISNKKSFKYEGSEYIGFKEGMKLTMNDERIEEWLKTC